MNPSDSPSVLGKPAIEKADVLGASGKPEAAIWQASGVFPTPEERAARAIEKYGAHVVYALGLDLPWNLLGAVAIERFKSKERMVYFIGGEHGAIKVGHTTAPLTRLATMQMGSPIPLRILALTKGGAVRERAYHAQFLAHRLHGEWFARCPEIEAEIERLNAAAQTALEVLNG